MILQQCHPPLYMYSSSRLLDAQIDHSRVMDVKYDSHLVIINHTENFTFVLGYFGLITLFFICFMYLLYSITNLLFPFLYTILFSYSLQKTQTLQALEWNFFVSFFIGFKTLLTLQALVQKLKCGVGSSGFLLINCLKYLIPPYLIIMEESLS